MTSGNKNSVIFRGTLVQLTVPILGGSQWLSPASGYLAPSSGLHRQLQSHMCIPPLSYTNKNKSLKKG